MPRHRLPEPERKEPISIRLKKELGRRIEEIGKIARGHRKGVLPIFEK